MDKILIIEDNELNRDMLSRRLSRRGFEISTATNGVEGVEQAKKIMPDLILMDLSLPEMDGWVATKTIKQNPSTSHIPIIALTAHALPDDEARAREAGCVDYATKPIDIDSLQDKIVAAIR